MSKKRSTPTPSAARAVSVERARRLYRLLKLLESGPKTRAAILRALRIDIRTFYRDLELLREHDIIVVPAAGAYRLEEDAGSLLPQLPFPDPNLSLGDAQALARGRTRVHQRLRKLVADVMS